MALAVMETVVSAGAPASADFFPAPKPALSPAEQRLLIDRLIVGIDQQVSSQLDVILRHPRVKQLEASWRGLLLLVETSGRIENVKVRLLNLAWPELCRDMARALEFDQSALFEKIYDAEFGTPGGEPYGILIGDYAISHKRSATHPYDDIGTLAGIAQVAAAAFAPFVASASPELLGLDELGELALPINVSAGFETADYTAWRSLRASEDARFLGLVLPNCLARHPYTDLGVHDQGFRYRTAWEVSREDDLVWMPAVYAFGASVVTAYGWTGWFTDIRGARRDEAGGGRVDGLDPLDFPTDSPGVAPRAPIDVSIDPAQERALDDSGLIPLIRAYATPLTAFYSNASLQKPPRYDRVAANVNARLSSMLQYMLCVARFAHYIKVLGRDKVGSYNTAADCQRMLQRWIDQYTTADEDSSAAMLAKYPLQEASIEVIPMPGQPGVYACTARLKPHFQLDQVVAAFKLVTTLKPPGTA